jgi:glycosyltransferase involved in cell wall biosynthesis
MNSFPKKICLLIHALSPGGMERVMSELIGYFAEKDHLEIHLVLYGIKRDIFYPLPKSIIIHRPNFDFLNSRRTLCTFKTLLYMRRTIKEIKPDSVLSFGEPWNNLVLLALYGCHVPVFVSDRAQPDIDLGRFNNKLRVLLYPKATGLIAQTEKAKEIALANKRNANIRVIGNPIRNVKPGLPEEKENIVLTVGRLIRTKHLDQLIRLFVRIDQPGWKLVIVGGDAQKQNLMVELQQLVRELDAADRVILAGNQMDVDSYYRRARIFAFTSSSEGFPNVVGEAMSAGLPVVSFDCVAGPSEMIKDGENGFLVPVFAYTTFEEKLRLLMDDPELQKKLGGNARQSIAKFSVESIGQQFYSFILYR